MPEFTVTSPDGRKFKIKAKDGVTQAQAQAYADKHFADFPAPPKAPSGLGEALADIPREIGHQFMEATRAQSKTVQDVEAKQQRLARGERHPGDFLPDLTVPKMLMNAMGQLSSPLSGAVISTVGRPVETATGGRLNREDVGNAAMMAVPFADELALSREASGLARTLGVSEKTAREALMARKQAAAKLAARQKATKYSKAKDALIDSGTILSPGMAAGGVGKRMENALGSTPFFGEAVRDGQAEARQSWNRAMYNRAVEPVGHVFTDKDMPLEEVGRNGLGEVRKKIGAVFDRAKAGIRFQVDDQFRLDDRDLRKRINILPEPQRGYVTRLLQQRLDPKLKKGVLNGQEFKDVESLLDEEARTAKGGNPYDRRVASILEDVQAIMRQNAERHSAPEVIQDLKNANEAWARYVRLRGASANRAVADEFTPGDLLASIKREDHSVGKGAFSENDALLQREATNAQRVLPDRVPQGSAERLEWASLGGLGGYLGSHFGPVGTAAGAAAGLGLPFVTNPAARSVLKALPVTSSEAAAAARASRPSALSAVAPAAGVAGEARKHSGITAEIEGKPETAVNLTPDLRVAGPTVYDDDGKAVSLKGSAPAAMPSPTPVQPAAPAPPPAAPKSGGVTVYDDSGKAITLQ